MAMMYDLHRLTPGGPVVEHINMPDGGRLETDGPWLFVFEAGGNARACFPAHAVVQVRACEGGGSCAAAPIR